MITVKNVSEFINSLAPYSTKCQWDNCGILVGDENKAVSKIGCALDLTYEVIDDAEKNGVEVIVTHHPVIFASQKNFLRGNIAYEAAVRGISVISAHTCFDCADGGVNDILCEILGIRNICGVPHEDCAVPMARIGDVDEMSPEEFSLSVARCLGTTCRAYLGKRKVRRAAVCGGAGMDFFLKAAEMGADAYVTGEVKHHEFLMAEQMGITVIEAGHFETENPSMAYMKKYLEEKFADIGVILLKQSNPVKFIG